MAKSEVSGAIIGLDKVMASLQAKSLKGRKQLTVSIEYIADHAIYVHEDLEANHPRGGQAKYLEQPARQYRNQMTAMIRRTILQKRSLEDALIAAGEYLLDKSRPLVPVDTGELRDSGRVSVYDGAPAGDHTEHPAIPNRPVAPSSRKTGGGAP